MDRYIDKLVQQSIVVPKAHFGMNQFIDGLLKTRATHTRARIQTTDPKLLDTCAEWIRQASFGNPRAAIRLVNSAIHTCNALPLSEENQKCFFHFLLREGLLRLAPDFLAELTHHRPSRDFVTEHIDNDVLLNRFIGHFTRGERLSNIVAYTRFLLKKLNEESEVETRTTVDGHETPQRYLDDFFEGKTLERSGLQQPLKYRPSCHLFSPDLLNSHEGKLVFKKSIDPYFNHLRRLLTQPTSERRQRDIQYWIDRLRTFSDYLRNTPSLASLCDEVYSFCRKLHLLATAPHLEAFVRIPREPKEATKQMLSLARDTSEVMTGLFLEDPHLLRFLTLKFSLDVLCREPSTEAFLEVYLEHIRDWMPGFLETQSFDSVELYAYLRAIHLAYQARTPETSSSEVLTYKRELDRHVTRLGHAFPNLWPTEFDTEVTETLALEIPERSRP
ncbi:hypothetical protein SCOR_04830 [Sulfidibacter corallicola]|uniref:Uncharacterized protein n=1 Tax=Sulfidibacter corallicola TaxID=2818388 RepID=A0A8A4TS97_SULCO|nr:hypothetical protein [Sulfidibacter corallicola]QTD51901.1 hypothetical protein J3U87_05465 [Sulfidibacter corallicola]